MNASIHTGRIRIREAEPPAGERRRRRKSHWIDKALLLSILFSGPIASADETHSARPNLLLIMAEDLSPRLGTYGDPIARTPHIDRLAQDGVRFTRAFTTAGVCAPSRAAMIMGVHQNDWGAGHMRALREGYAVVPPPDWKAFPELLRAAGYYVINNGKTDYQMGGRLGGAFGGPITIWDEESGRDWRNRPREDQPFFAYLTLEATHESQVWPTWSLNSMTRAIMAPLRIPNHLGWPIETDPSEVPVPSYYPDTPTVRADIARHYNNVAHMDEQVGEILARLEADGLADDTIVIFMTDHGDGLPRAKRWVYDSGIHVPLIVRWPDRSGAGHTNEELVSGVDLAPTLLALAEIPRPDHFQGRVFAGPDREAEPAYIFAARDRIDEQPDTVRAVRDRRYKYIRHFRPDQPYVLEMSFRNQMPMMQEMLVLAAEGKLSAPANLWFRKTRDPEELFDTLRDPEELHNLVGDPEYRAEHERLAAALDARLASGNDLGFLPESDLRERFWPGGEQPRTALPEMRTDSTGRIVLTSPTEGASIQYQKNAEGWKIYSVPIDVRRGDRIVARADRYGWAASDSALFLATSR